MWTYWWYADPDPKKPCPWRAWYDARDSSVQGRHDDVFRYLEGRKDWREPHAKAIGDVVEVILKTKVQHRLLGFYWPKGTLQFTFLLPCTHKGKVYSPKEAFKTANKYIGELKNGSKWIRRCVRPE
jgi:hypothetical protein